LLAGRGTELEGQKEAWGEKEDPKGNPSIQRPCKKQDKKKEVSEGMYKLSDNKAVHHPKQRHQASTDTPSGLQAYSPHPGTEEGLALKALPFFAQQHLFSKEQKGLMKVVK